MNKSASNTFTKTEVISQSDEETGTTTNTTSTSLLNSTPLRRSARNAARDEQNTTVNIAVTPKTRGRATQNPVRSSRASAKTPTTSIEASTEETASKEEIEEPIVQKAKGGRPKKVVIKAETVSDEQDVEATDNISQTVPSIAPPETPSRRGRPRKIVSEIKDEIALPQTPRPRGRPRKQSTDVKKEPLQAVRRTSRRLKIENNNQSTDVPIKSNRSSTVGKKTRKKKEDSSSEEFDANAEIDTEEVALPTPPNDDSTTDDSVDEFQNISTPRSKKPKGRATPKSVLGRRKLKTLAPITPLRRRQIKESNSDDHFEQARQNLHVSAVPLTLPCREDEFSEILAHVESSLEDDTGSCIYISGVPGTGKTATVHEVIRNLQGKAEEGDIAEFQFVEINGMKLTEPSYAYTLLYEALTGERVTAKHASDLLEKMFTSSPNNRKPCLVLMDELDLLVTRKQTVMYNFFEWPNRPNSRLIVIAVANTMDLPERILSNKISSRLGLTRINFQPYSHQQLYSIIQSRLVGNNAFDSDAMEFCARKVSAVSGDARRALDICRRAVELVETAHKGDQAKTNGQPIAQVTMSMVDKAIKEMYASSNVKFIQNASLHQKMFLVSLNYQLRKGGLPEVEFGEVANYHIQICRLNNLEPPNTSDLAAICASLGAARCLLVEAGRLDLHQRIRLNVAEEDVTMALRADPFFRKMV
ncbi:Origin recognition complex, subunit 1 [Basidiobolus ranarum]|uniref:Origin recognition complex subunit 1 n=1 Tax=Basidiobolus ranarum TaxID=34480 RepID=A0ABR2X320_9FUNG